MNSQAGGVEEDSDGELEPAVGGIAVPEESEGNTAELFAELEARCEVADMETSLDEREGRALLRLAFQAGRDKRYVTVRNAEGARALLATQFENYRFVDGYEAIYSLTTGDVEALVGRVAAILPGGVGFMRRLFGPKTAQNSEPWTSPVVLSSSSGEVQIELGLQSGLSRVMLDRAFVSLPLDRFFSIKVKGAGSKTHDEAKRVLENYADSVFFQIDAKLGVPIQLTRERRSREQFRRRRVLGETLHAVTFPHTAYDSEPMRLYWYGRGAAGMPLLQFLAFYQVIEFYFPRYSQEAVRARLRALVKDPAFNPHSEADIGRLVDAMGAKGARTIGGDERAQLLTTLRRCVDADAIRNLIDSEQYDGYFGKKAKGLTDVTVRATASDDDLIVQMAERIYEIRCRIVHTKDVREGEEIGLLLPFTPEADRLGPDINLAELAARRVLTAAGRPIFGGRSHDR
jgi:hypothetical protein